MLVFIPGAPVWAQISQAEYQTARCIDRYNTDPQFRAAQANIPENPAVILRLRPFGAALGAADGNDVDGGRVAFGGAVDADTLITLFTTGHTRTGLTAGLSGSSYWVPDHSFAYGGELRLGLARRRYGVPLFEPSLLRFLRPSDCRFERVDLALDLMRWRVHGLKKLGVDQPTTFVSSIGTLVPSLRFTYSDWGWRLMISLLDFRLAPSFLWGISAGTEAFIGFLSVGANIGSYLLPSPHLYGTIAVGFRFELGEGLSLN